jgi:hypothetical protein
MSLANARHYAPTGFTTVAPFAILTNPIIKCLIPSWPWLRRYRVRRQL